MKKIIILTVVVLCFTLILIFSIALYNKPTNKTTYKDYASLITSNSSWIDLNNSDFNSIILKTYSDKILSFIDSLENGIPVIVELEGGKYCEPGKNNFVVASGFTTSNAISIYSKSDDSYNKLFTSLEELLEYATRFFIINDAEVLKWEKFLSLLLLFVYAYLFTSVRKRLQTI